MCFVSSYYICSSTERGSALDFGTLPQLHCYNKKDVVIQWHIWKMCKIRALTLWVSPIKTSLEADCKCLCLIHCFSTCFVAWHFTLKKKILWHTTNQKLNLKSQRLSHHMKFVPLPWEGCGQQRRQLGIEPATYECQLDAQPPDHSAKHYEI